MSVDAGEFDDSARFTRVVTPFDADRDGDTDLAVGYLAEASRLYLNDGQGRFTATAAGDFDDVEVGASVIRAFDADGDGDMDLVVTYDGGSVTPPGYIAIYLNDGKARFTRASAGDLVQISQTIVDIAVLDAEGDGDQDLALSATGGQSAIYLNDGSGSFARSLAAGFAGADALLVAFDANHDGVLDLATAGTTGYRLFLNDGSGTFAETGAGDFGGQPTDSVIELGVLDANHDGFLDLAVALRRQLLVFLNNGVGAFSRVSVADPDMPTAISSLAVFDINGDGFPDLAVGTYKQKHAIYLNDGNGQFRQVSGGDFGQMRYNSYALAPFDADSDGDLDLAVGNWDSPAQPNEFYLNHSRTDAGVSLASAGFREQSAGSFGERGWYARAMVTLDADMDGDPDIAVIAHSPSFGDSAQQWYMRLFRNGGGGHFVGVDAGDFGGSIPGTPVLTVCDVDGDHDPDLMTHRALYLNDGHGQFVRDASGQLFIDPGDKHRIVPLDADDDGDIDLAVAYRDYNGNRLYINDGAGHFVGSDAGAFNYPNLNNGALVAFDADGDGDQDLALGRYDSYALKPKNRLFLNAGTGRFTESEAGDFGNPLTLVPSSIVPFDIDGDGDIDLALGGCGNALLLNDGHARFTIVASGEFGPENGICASQKLQAFDADADGDLDLAAGNELNFVPYTNTLYLNDGHANFTRQNTGDFTKEIRTTYALAAVDIDSDGDVDLITGNGDGNALYLNDGHALYYQTDTGEFDDGHGIRTTALVSFDANGDSYTDIVIGRGRIENELHINDGHGSFIFADGGDYGATNHATVRVVAFDADRDGDFDIVETTEDGAPAANILYVNDGHGHFSVANAGSLDQQAQRVVLAFDADGDGDQDLLLGNSAAGGAGERTLIYLNDGMGHFVVGDAGELDDAPRALRMAAAVDVNRDGAIDLIIADSSLIPALYLNDGAGRFARGDAGELDDAPISLLAIVPLDSDGDGDQDLAVQFGSDYTRLYVNNGTGVFMRRDAGDIGGSPASRASVCDRLSFAADMNGDGYRDMVCANSLFLNDGLGRFTKSDGGDLDRLPSNLKGVSALDVDGDGDLDVARATGDAGQLLLSLGLHESGQMTSTVISPTALYPHWGDFLGWYGLKVCEDHPENTSLTYDLLDPVLGQPIPGYASLQPDAAGLIGFADLDPTAYPAIQIRVTFADLNSASDYNDRSPVVRCWRVLFHMSNPQITELYLPYIMR
jgi:hypothetical protein